MEAVLWQLYEAAFRPSLKYMTGSISWLCLTVNRHTFVVKTQRIVDYCIEGCITVENPEVFNKMQDASAEFHYQLFKLEHRSYYGELDVQILDECRSSANVGYLRRLIGVSRGIRHRLPVIHKSSLVEIDITKAYAGAFLRIRAVGLQ